MTSSDDTFERDLAVALAAEAPRARPGFKEELRERVDAGFPRERRFSAAVSRRRLMPALAVATCAVAAVSVVGLTGTTSRRRPARRRDRGRAAPPSRRPRPRPRSRPPTDRDFAPGRERRIERSARMTLQVPATGWRRPARASWTPPTATAATCSARRWARARTRAAAPTSCACPPPTCATRCATSAAWAPCARRARTART